MLKSIPRIPTICSLGSLACGILIGYWLGAHSVPARLAAKLKQHVEWPRAVASASPSGPVGAASAATSAGEEVAAAQVIPAQESPLPDIQVAKSHPRFWGTDAEVAELKAKAGTREGQAIVKDALARANGPSDKAGDRLLCAAFFYRFGADLAVDAGIIKSLGAQAVDDLMAATIRQGDNGFGGAPWAIAYDWLQPLLTAEQKSKLVATGVTLLSDRNPADGQTWRGYNQLSGDCPMATALAIHGDQPTDYVSDVYANNWFAARPRFYNYAWQKQAWADGGSREGFAQYFSSCQHNFATRALWETATGDRSLDIGYFRNTPYWHLFQCAPDSISAGHWPLPLYTSTFSGGQGSNRGLWNILQACTRFSDEKGKQLARWLIDQSMGWTGVDRTPGDALLYGLLIGDPRVKGADPAKLGIPLTFTMAQPGEIFIRSDWTAKSNLVWFGNHTTASRVTPTGELTLYSKGAYLLGNAATRIGHSYGCRWFLCGVCFVGEDGTPAFNIANPGSVPDYLQRGTFSVSSAASTVTVAAACAANFAATKGGPPASLIQRCDRSFTCDASVSAITLTDDIACDPSLTPHLVFPCPTEPKVKAENGQWTVTITNGPASCTLTFSPANWQMNASNLLAIGGPANYCDGLPGTAYAGKPYLVAGSVLDTDFGRLAASKKPADQAQALKQMGYWRLHVVLPPGGAKLTTAIAVH